MPTIIGIDHGNGWVKGKSVEKEIVLPSCYAREDAFGDDVTTKASMNLKKYESSAAKGEVYAWGPDVQKANKVIATYGSQDRYQQNPYRLLSEFAIAELLPDGQDSYEDVWVITGCPSKEKGTVAEEQLKEVFMGGHIVRVNGQDKIFRVTRVVVLPQPVGTIMSLYLDKDGFVADEDYETDYVAIVDVGSGTTDLDGIRELRRQSDDMKSLPYGMFDVYKKLAAWIDQQNPAAQATPQKVELQFKEDAYTVSKRSTIDMSAMKDNYVKELADDIVNGITQQWPNRQKFDKLILTGGGASVLGKHLQRFEKDIIVIKNSQTANVHGFYRYGQYLKGE